MDIKNRLNSSVELLAPAGDYECFRAVMGAGADAVYCGGRQFGARAYAGNFDTDELIGAIREAHVLGKKLYLTVNTLMKNRELYGELYDYLAPFYEAGLDAVLVQDFGVLSFIKKNFPDLPIHASTQMTVTGPEGMALLDSLGVSRIVAARELSLYELRLMHERSDLEIEAFIHGAMCYCFSGRCLMSSLIGGRSGNRGRCAQPCRLPYEVSADSRERRGGQGSFKDKSRRAKAEEYTPLSLKDMNTIDILPEIVSAGICSLKIEGRMKKKEYAAGVTAVYRKYLDMILTPGFDPGNYRVDREDRERLTDLFSRGGSYTGYYKDYHGKKMMEFQSSRKTGEAAADIREPRTGIRGTIRIKTGEPLCLLVSAGGQEVSAEGEVPERASDRPVSEENVRSKLEKLGNTEFYWEDLKIDMDEGLFVPMTVINRLRRDACERLYNKMADGYKRVLSPAAETERRPDRMPVESPRKERCVTLSASCEDRDTAFLLLKEKDLKRLYVPLRFAGEILDERKRMALSGLDVPELYVSLPMMTRNLFMKSGTNPFLQYLEKGASGFLVRDMEMLGALTARGLSEYIIADASLYTWNDEAVRFLDSLGTAGNTAPYELNEGELRHRDCSRSEMVIYGYLPVMVSQQCVRMNCTNEGCTGKCERASLKDRTGKTFTVQCCCEPFPQSFLEAACPADKEQNTKKQPMCCNIIYNSLPFGLPDEKEQVAGCGMRSLRLSFTIETPEEALSVYREYAERYVSGTVPASGSRGLTKGHFKRGVM